MQHDQHTGLYSTCICMHDIHINNQLKQPSKPPVPCQRRVGRFWTPKCQSPSSPHRCHPRWLDGCCETKKKSPANDSEMIQKCANVCKTITSHHQNHPK